MADLVEEQDPGGQTESTGMKERVWGTAGGVGGM